MTVATHTAHNPPPPFYHQPVSPAKSHPRSHPGSVPAQQLALQMPQQPRQQLRPSGAGLSHQSSLTPQTPTGRFSHSGSGFPPRGSPSPSGSGTKRKRSAVDDDNNDQSPQDAPGNERLSKRLSLLNLEHAAKRLHLTRPSDDDLASDIDLDDMSVPSDLAGIVTSAPESPYVHHGHSSPNHHPSSDHMEMDDTKHRVFIYNLDDELSSSDVEPDDNQVTIHPEYRKHFLANRPQFSTAASADDQAGKQLVLYREPAALTVPEEQDTVRKAVVEARQRIRERQRAEAETAAAAGASWAAPVEEARSRAQTVQEIQGQGVGGFGRQQAVPPLMSTDAFMMNSRQGGFSGQPGSYGSSTFSFFSSSSSSSSSSFATPPIVSLAFDSHTMYAQQNMHRQPQQQTVYDVDAMDMDID